ncbi:DUF6308 family protein [Dactylosporangium sp. NPDC051541]|uniref:DUF6308 family protein n=1 Tax=Dactylosporangium sp. NPDC051541 TaxID=3363977 RepID=UPI0037919E40
MDFPPSDDVLDVTRDFPGNVLGPIPVAAATRRLLAYCTTPGSGWSSYDLAAHHARRFGILDSVTSWSLLYANALNGQVTLDNIAAFDRSLRRDFAGRLAKVPPGRDLQRMASDETSAVVDVCCFGFRGVWGPKATKMAALYRPNSVPVLDGHVAEAFGYDRDAFSVGTVQRGLSRRERIETVVRALARGLVMHSAALTELRRAVSPTVPEVKDVSDLRLLDMVLWTAQDDRMARRSRQGPCWIDRPIGKHIDIEQLAPEPVAPTGTSVAG